MPIEPLNAQEQALGTGDPGQIMPAVGGMGAVCGKCHLVHQPAAFAQRAGREAAE